MLKEELQISGALIWRSINALNKVYFNHDKKADVYPFLTLYLASQSIERTQKAIAEFICKKEHIKEKDKNKVYGLLFSNSHNKLNNCKYKAKL